MCSLPFRETLRDLRFGVLNATMFFLVQGESCTLILTEGDSAKAWEKPAP